MRDGGRFASGYGKLAARLAEAVGLGSSATTGFTIEVFPDDCIRVRSNHVATEGAVEQVARVFEVEGQVAMNSSRPFIPVARLEDVRARAAAGTLTNAERLALAVLAGGRDGEEGVGALIDAAQEEYGHGSYRVPVRIVADKSRLRLVLTPPAGSLPLSDEARRHISGSVRDWVAGQNPYILLPAGWTVQAWEIGDAVSAEVETSEAPHEA